MKYYEVDMETMVQSNKSAAEVKAAINRAVRSVDGSCVITTTVKESDHGKKGT